MSLSSSLDTSTNAQPSQAVFLTNNVQAGLFPPNKVRNHQLVTFAHTIQCL